MRGDFLNEGVPLGVFRRQALQMLVVSLEALDARRTKPAAKAVGKQGFFLRRHTDTGPIEDDFGVEGQLGIAHFLRRHKGRQGFDGLDRRLAGICGQGWV